MNTSDDIIACARLVEEADQDRFRTVMAAPLAARKLLFPIYAFNVEVSRAPWVTSEPMIAEMRLQWWRDALEEISDAKPVRKHPITTSLATILSPSQARRLDSLVAARRWDIYRDPFEDQSHMDTYLSKTSGQLMWTASELLGASADFEGEVRAVAYGLGCASFLCAVPALVASGRTPLLDLTNDGLVTLACCAKSKIKRVKLQKQARPALWPAIKTIKILDQVIKDPSVVTEGGLRSKITSFELSWLALFGC
ncbi:MAG: squalene/phytoene synthase family protein [Tateyamaria sp.]|nr:squalene/phytoene synthase family protein [Tateyamaria sp.]MDG1420468.1 squalene/phytoene synthase family protein [Tateyamaria sp.]MDG2379115.1 squalene/phytoene synthase family protein [Tateyamaria sp.]